MDKESRPSCHPVIIAAITEIVGCSEAAIAQKRVLDRATARPRLGRSAARRRQIRHSRACWAARVVAPCLLFPHRGSTAKNASILHALPTSPSLAASFHLVAHLTAGV